MAFIAATNGAVVGVRPEIGVDFTLALTQIKQRPDLGVSGLSAYLINRQGNLAARLIRSLDISQ